MSVSIEKIVVEHRKWLEGLSKATVGMGILREIYAPDVHYRDPFRDAVGIESLHDIYEKMFNQFDQIEIIVTGQAINGSMVFLSWKMLVKVKNKEGSMEGTTRLLFKDKGLITESLDFFDASVAFEAVPILGRLIKCLRKRM